MVRRLVYLSTLLHCVFGNHRKKGVLWLSSPILLFSCVLFLFFGRLMPDRNTSFRTNTAASTSATPATTPTKWWLKTPSSFSPTTSTEFKSSLENDCPPTLSSPLRPGIYAYISLTPPLPNRVRAGAGKTVPHLGQLQPGDGVKIIEGPLCADGLLWWLVESAQNDLRGWTVGGRETEQWVIPCPNPAVSCIMTPLFFQATPTAVPSSTHNNNKNTCTSDKFFIGMLAQVEPDNLLVIRSEPYSGSLIVHAGPTSAVTIIDGPACAGGAVWWEVHVASLDLIGWATEANLRACTKEDGCT